LVEGRAAKAATAMARAILVITVSSSFGNKTGRRILFRGGHAAARGAGVAEEDAMTGIDDRKTGQGSKVHQADEAFGPDEERRQRDRAEEGGTPMEEDDIKRESIERARDAAIANRTSD
jgi:hypothetical protein